MKRYTTKFLKTIALVYLFFPVFYVVTITIIFDIPLSVWLNVLWRPYFWILGALCVLTGYGLWEMKRWVWYLFLGINTLICYETAHFVYENARNSHKVLAYFGIVGVLLGVVYRIRSEIRVPY